MSKLGFSILVLVGMVWATAHAQTETDSVELQRSIIETERKMIVAKNLDLSEEEGEAFWKVYNDFQRDLREVGDLDESAVARDVMARGVWHVREGVVRVRGTFETTDGARIYMQYYGVVVINDKVAEALAEGRETQYGDTYFMTQPRFETGDPRYAWLNSTVAVSQGRVLPNAVEYRVYEVVSE